MTLNNILFAGALALATASTTTFAAASDDFVRVPAQGSVSEVADRLEAAVTGAGATVFARVDHAKGAASIDMALPEAQLLIFGNPKIGTPVMQDDLRAGLVLPLRVLVYDDGGQTTMLYEAPSEMLDDLNIPADAPYLAAIAGALTKLTGAAAQ